MKHCPRCQITKDLKDFSKDRHQHGGYKSSCKLCSNSLVNEWRSRNPEYMRVYNMEYAKHSGWAKKYPERNRYKRACHRAAISCRVPKWADLSVIKQFYINCPKGYEVDHIIPLRGKNISGLHIIENLQYLPQQQNRIKGNRF